MRFVRLATLIALVLAAGAAWAPPFGRPAPHPAPPRHEAPPLFEPPRHEAPPPFEAPHNDPSPRTGHDSLAIDKELLEQLNQIGGDQRKELRELLREFGLDPKQKSPSEKANSQLLEELSEGGKTAVSVDAEGQPGRHSRLNVTIAHGGRVTRKTVDVPTWEFFKLERAVVQRRMAKAFEGVPVDSPVFFTSLPPGLSSSDLLPGRITARTFDKSVRFVEDHARNLEKLQSEKLDAANTKFFNFVGPPIGSGKGRESRWSKLRTQYDDVATTLGLRFGSGKEELLRTLEDGNTDVVVVVAHGDRSSIYLPDGSSLTVRDVLDLPPISRDRAPIVVLLSCETGNSSGEGITTLAEALMLRGRAAAIFAPTRQVSAGRKTAELLDQVVRSAEGGEFGGLMKRLRGPWQVIVETTKAKLFEANECKAARFKECRGERTTGSDKRTTGSDTNGTYFSFFGCPFSRTYALASARGLVSIG